MPAHRHPPPPPPPPPPPTPHPPPPTPHPPPPPPPPCPTADAAEAVNDKGNIEWNLELTAAACASYNQALDIRQRCLPPDHPDIAESLGCLALLKAEEEEDFEGALGLYERQLVILELAVGASHPDTLHCHDGMGVRPLSRRQGGGSMLRCEAPPRCAHPPCVCVCVRLCVLVWPLC